MISYRLFLLVLANWPLARRSPAVAIADSLAGQVSGTPRYLGLQYNPAIDFGAVPFSSPLKIVLGRCHRFDLPLTVVELCMFP